MINSLLRLLGFYDFNGLKYSIAHLDRMKNKIPLWSREDQARYVDRVTKNNVNNETIAFQVLTMPLDEPPESPRSFMMQYNTTAVGNLAYISLHCENKQVRDMAEKLLANLRDWTLHNKIN